MFCDNGRNQIMLQAQNNITLNSSHTKDKNFKGLDLAMI